MEYKLFRLYEKITSVGPTLVELSDGSLVEVDKSLIPLGQRVIFLPLSGEDDGDYRWETGNVTGGNISYSEVVPGVTAFWATDPFEESVLAWRVAWQFNEEVDNLAATPHRLHHPDFGLDGCSGLTDVCYAVHSGTSYYQKKRCWNRRYNVQPPDDPNPRRKGESITGCPFPQNGCRSCADTHDERCISG